MTPSEKAAVIKNEHIPGQKWGKKLASCSIQCDHLLPGKDVPIVESKIQCASDDFQSPDNGNGKIQVHDDDDDTDWSRNQKHSCDSIRSPLRKRLNIKVQTLAIVSSLVMILTVTLSAGIVLVILKILHQNYAVSTNASSTISTKEGVTYRHRARSLDEYNVIVRTNKHNDLELRIKTSQPGDWPLGGNVEKSTGVVKSISISGPFHVNKIIELVDVTISLETLTLNNEFNLICSESQQPLGMLSKKTTSFQPKILILEKMSFSCGILLQSLAGNLRPYSLQELEINGGILSKDLRMQLQSILLSSQQTLSRIEMHDIVVDQDVFNTGAPGAFIAVTSLIYDFSFQSQTSSNFKALTKYCSRFPNLQHLSFGKHYRTYSEILSIGECPQLKTLSVKMKMSQHQTNFSVAFIRKNFPRLESFDITLNFETCSAAVPDDHSAGSDGKYILGLKMLPDMLLVNTRIRSNCDLIHL